MVLSAIPGLRTPLSAVARPFVPGNVQTAWAPWQVVRSCYLHPDHMNLQENSHFIAAALSGGRTSEGLELDSNLLEVIEAPLRFLSSWPSSESESVLDEAAEVPLLEVRSTASSSSEPEPAGYLGQKYQEEDFGLYVEDRHETLPSEPALHLLHELGSLPFGALSSPDAKLDSPLSWEECSTPRLRALLCPSVGSRVHASGHCRPCAFLHAKGCKNGSACTFCHLCREGEKKRRKRNQCTRG